MKKGYHTTQSKAFGTIPRSEYLGIVVGFAVGLILTGALGKDQSVLELICAVVGFAIGWWVDGKYYAEPDVPAEELEAMEAAETPESPETQQDDE